ncbi:putative flavoprotein [Umbelopsis sp. PMI_123]|nr:putative flavoprotein [Umbelopsis sp. PMI_123]
MKQDIRIGVIGAGFSGMCAAIQVKKQLGIDAEIIDKDADFGGTWHANTYPGCACDIPSHVYSFSFELNPYWSRFQSPRQEIAAYLRYVAAKYGLYNQTKFNTEVVAAHWMESDQMWKVTVRKACRSPEGVTVYGDIEDHYYNILFVGVGPLMVPNKPKMFEPFQGKVVHTAKWDSSIDMRNKRIAVIGSGASAIQAIPELAKEVKTLYSYQRRPAWIGPSRGGPYSQRMKFLFAYVPFFMRIYRFLIFMLLDRNVRIFNRPQEYNELARERFAAFMVRQLTRLNRKDLIEKLVPTYPVGCKRIAYSHIYLEAMARDNVVVERSPIAAIKSNSIVTEDGQERDIDVLVLATGFITQDYLGPLQVYGQNGLSLKTYWKENGFPKTYKTVTVNQFPNFFCILGPGSGLGHNSVVIMAECQVNYAVDLIKKMIRKKIKSVNVKAERAQEFSNNLDKELSSTVWSQNCMSWYQNAMGKVTLLWSRSVTEFWWATRTANVNDYEQIKYA